jgi:hypothetical protein
LVNVCRDGSSSGEPSNFTPRDPPDRAGLWWCELRRYRNPETRHGFAENGCKDANWPPISEVLDDIKARMAVEITAMARL